MKDKELLLKDLCGRLPYGVVIKHVLRSDLETSDLFSIDTDKQVVYCRTKGREERYGVEFVMPYLRSMSSMTEEERETYRNLQHDVWCNEYSPTYYESIASLDWLNKNMFDYRGLIPRGLAIEAPSGMYKEKESV